MDAMKYAPSRVISQLVKFLKIFPRPGSAFEMGILEQCERFDVGTVELRADARRLFAASGLSTSISQLRISR